MTGFATVAALTGIHQQQSASRDPSGPLSSGLRAIPHKIASASSGVSATVAQTSGSGDRRVAVALARGFVMSFSQKIAAHRKIYA